MTIDYWQLARDFSANDYVQAIDVVTGGLSPYLGRVLAVQPGLGTVDVYWPFGQQRHHADEIVKVVKTLARYLPPTLDPQGGGADVARSRLASNVPQDLWDHRRLPATFYTSLARAWSKGASEVVAYDNLYREHGAQVDDDLLRHAVQKFYLASANLQDMRVRSHARTAAYWYAGGRTYRVTRGEVEKRCPSCPKCGASMRKTTYKMHEGARHRLFACPKDLFLIKTTDLVGPNSEPVEW